jgi:hypothetical protein
VRHCHPEEAKRPRDLLERDCGRIRHDEGTPVPSLTLGMTQSIEER